MKLRHALIAGISLSGLTAPVLAQDNAVSNDSGLGDIVVTAQKREQNLQSVPVTVTALTSDTLAKSRIVDFADLTRAVSALTITQRNNSPNNSTVLRGIGTSAFSIGVEPSVAVIIDDVPVVQQAQAFDGLMDLERIEVLEGPQGTLFGKNASAGVINIVTKDPNSRLGGAINLTAATDADYRAEASISGPLNDAVGFRLSGYYRSFAGNVRNLTTGHKLNDVENYGFRGKLKAGVTDTLDITLAGSYAKQTQNGTGTTIRYIDPAGTPRIQGLASLPLRSYIVRITPGKRNYRGRFDAASPVSNQVAAVSAKANLDVGFANVISVTAYQDWKYDFTNDQDGTEADVLGAATNGVQHGSIRETGPYHSTNLTQELRLVSSGSGPLKYVVGTFYSDARTTRSYDRGPVLTLASWRGVATSNSLAAFTQVDYRLPTKTTLSAGLRYNREKVGVAFDNYLANATANSCAAGNPLCRGTNVDHVVTWKGSISQELTHGVLAYTSVARGYKGFAYDVSTGFNPARINGALAGTGTGLNGAGIIKPEKSTSYEVGVKSRFLDNKVQLNVVGYLADYSNFQAQASVIVNNTIQSVLTNVGTLRTKGVDVSLSAKPTQWLRFDGSASYTDAVTRSFTGAPAYAGQAGAAFANGTSMLVTNCTTALAATATSPNTICQFQDRSGSRLPNSPKFKYTVGATVEAPVAEGVEGIATLSYQHQSSVNFDLLGNPLLSQKAYGILNGNVGFTFGRYQVTAFVNNLLDTHYASFLSDAFGTNGGSATNPAHVVLQFQPRDSQRYLGLRLGAQF